MKTAHDLVMAAKARINEFSVTDAHSVLVNADVLIDVREPAEFQQGHISGAINIPRGLLEFKIGSMQGLDSRDTQIVLYCKTSGRSALAGASLAEMGYINVSALSGGIDAWIEAGNTVVKPELPSFD